MRVAVVGSGSWGTALATVLARGGHDTWLVCRSPDVVEAIRDTRLHPKYLIGVPLPPGLHATVDSESTVAQAELVVLACPSHVMREVAEKVRPFVRVGTPIVCASKGIEVGTLMTMNEVLEDVLPMGHHPYLSYLGGPSFAREVALALPTAVVVAAPWERLARTVQQAFTAPAFRVYTSTDVAGVELGGAVKNVIAIAAGASDGLGFGHNARSGLITRGLAEMGRLAQRRGAHPLTLSGLAGMGDLVLTCTGELSRNRTVGLRLGRGEPLSAILGDMTEVAEGVRTAQSVTDLGRRSGVELPLCEAVRSVLYDGRPPREAVAALLSREPKSEFAA